MTIQNIVDKWNGCLNYRRWTVIFRKDFFLEMKHISHSVCMLINKILAFEVLTILKSLKRLHYIQSNCCCCWCALLSEGLIESYFFENNDGTTVTVNSKRLFCLVLKNTTWRIYGLNNTVSHATQLERIWLYCKRHFLVA